MAHFLGDVVVKILKDNEHPTIFETWASVDFYSDHLGYVVTVPEGFRTDLASIPRMLLSFTGFKGGRAAIVHDYLCRIFGLARRSDADKVFEEALIASGFDAEEADAWYWAVCSRTAEMKQAAKQESDDYIA